MALVLRDRVQETTTTTGTGTITLAGAVSGFQSFAAIGNANTTYYTIQGGSQWEVGIGTYTSSGTTLSRDTVLESSNSGNLVNFSAGTKTVFVTYPAERAVYVDSGAIIPAVTGVLGVANGGTGVTTSTGSGSVVLSTSPTLDTPTLGAASSTSIANALGAVTTPSYTFTGDLNTGVWSPAADTVALSTNGAERLRIDSEGRIDMRSSMNETGSSTDSSISGTTLTIGGTVTGTFSVDDRVFGPNVAPNTFITALGTGTGGAGTYTINNTQTAASGTIRAIGGGNNVFRFTDTDAGVQVNQPIGIIEWYGSDSSSPGAGVKGYITVINERTTPDTAMIFGTSDNVANTQAVERMRIDSNGDLQFDSGYGSVATAYGCRAWVNFNGTGTVAIRNSGNVSSITDNGTGDFTVNFTTAMPDVNYSITATAARQTSTGATNQNSLYINGTAGYLSGSVRIGCSTTQSTTLVDPPICGVAIFR